MTRNDHSPPSSSEVDLLNPMSPDSSIKHRDSLFRALRHIQAHLESELTLEEVAAEANLSPYHFHRLFKTFTGENVKAYIRRLRLELAAFRIRTKQERIVDIAFDSGFYTHETFTRAFNKQFGLNPSEYKKCKATDYVDSYIDRIERVYFRGRMCIFKRHIGPYEKSGSPEEPDSLWHQLAQYLPKERRDLSQLELFGISNDDPGITDSSKIRYDACIGIPEDLPQGDTTLNLKSGYYIAAHHRGPFSKLTDSYYYIIYKWLSLYNLQINHRIAPFEQFHLKSHSDTTKLDNITIFIPYLPTNGG